MPSHPRSIHLTLPWCEADDDAYVDAIRDAIAAQDIHVAKRLGDGRIALALQVFPAHYSACTLVNCVAALYDAMKRLRNCAGIARIDCRFGEPSDTPRLQVTIRRS